VLLAVSAAAAQTSAPAPTQNSRDVVRTYLTQTMGLAEADLAQIDAGKVVTKFLAVGGPQDVALFGAVRITGQPAQLIQQLRNIEVFDTRLGAAAAGRFAATPSLDDLRALTLEPADLTSLSTCQPQSCGVNLTAGAMARIKQAVDWQAPDANDQATRYYRQMLLDLMVAYRQNGHAGIGELEDPSAPAALGAVVAPLLVARDVPSEAAGLFKYLSDYPKATLRGADDVFFWEKLSFGLRPTIRLAHMVLDPITDARGRRDGLRFVIATKYLHASHYLSATVDVRSVVDDFARPGKSFFLFHTSRSRIKGLDTLLGAVVRTALRNRSLPALGKALEDTKRLVETPAR